MIQVFRLQRHSPRVEGFGLRLEFLGEQDRRDLRDFPGGRVFRGHGGLPRRQGGFFLAHVIFQARNTQTPLPLGLDRQGRFVGGSRLGEELAPLQPFRQQGMVTRLGPIAHHAPPRLLRFLGRFLFQPSFPQAAQVIRLVGILGDKHFEGRREVFRSPRLTIEADQHLQGRFPAR